MKTSTFILSILLLSVLLFSSINSKASGGHASKNEEKTWTRWELSPNADIYYRVEISSDKDAATSNSIEVEFLNNYKKAVSFCFALNDTGIPGEVRYQPIYKLKKNKSIVSEYPRPKNNEPLVVSISSLEVGK